MTSTNDVHKDTFESKLDPYFTGGYVEKGRRKIVRNNEIRSALATTRPIKRGSFKVWSETY